MSDATGRDQVPGALTEADAAAESVPFTPKKRDSSLELLRIVAMLLIVANHFSGHGPWPHGTNYAKDLVLDFLVLGGKTGVNVFILITGYFMIDSMFKVRSLLRVYAATIFYSLGALAIFVLAGSKLVTANTVFRGIFPVITGTYWFVAAYIGVYLLSPYLNRLANAMTRTAYKRLLIICFVIFSVIPTLAPIVTAPTLMAVQFVYAWLPWFAFLYLLGGYFKRYPIEKFSQRQWVFVLLGSIAFIYGSMAVLVYVRNVAGIAYLSPIFFRNMNMVPALAVAVSAFFVFKGLKLKHNTFINAVGGTVFGVFLIHDNQFTEAWLWKHFKFAYHFHSWELLLFGLAVAVGVFIVCAAIDYLRIIALERPGFRLLDKVAAKRLDRWDAWMNGEERADS